MKMWRIEMTSGGEALGEVKIRRGIFQGDSLSPLLFVLTLIPMTMVLNATRTGNKLGKSRGHINNLLFMDDLNLYAKNVKELDSLVQTLRDISEDIAMEFVIQKCAMVVMRRGRMVESKGIDLPNGETIKVLEENEGYKYLGILEYDKLKSCEMKEILRNEYFRRMKKILKSKFNAGNIIKAKNSRAVSIIRYGAGLIEWTKEELKEMDRKSGKILTIYNVSTQEMMLTGCIGRGLKEEEDCRAS
jgi:hypothetical protein